jgi:hypothetical protein
MPVAFLPGAAAIAVASFLGFWWAPAIVGLALGLLLDGGRGLLVAALAGAAGWGVAFGWTAYLAPLAPTADVMAGILGVQALGGVMVIAATVLVGALLAFVGAWVGAASRRLVT